MTSTLKSCNFGNEILTHDAADTHAYKAFESSLGESEEPRDCADIWSNLVANDQLHPSGIYTIYNPEHYYEMAEGFMLQPINVYCDMRTNGGGWTVFQRRSVGDVDFYREWDEYENGFGNLNGDYWLGLRFINMISKLRSQTLSIRMKRPADSVDYFALYADFTLGDMETNYNVGVSTLYAGNLGDGLSRSNFHGFSTKDRDHDSNPTRHCAEDHQAGWWFHNCADSNLNGVYEADHPTGMWWFGPGNIVQETQMGFRVRFFD